MERERIQYKDNSRSIQFLCATVNTVEIESKTLNSSHEHSIGRLHKLNEKQMIEVGRDRGLSASSVVELKERIKVEEVQNEVWQNEEARVERTGTSYSWNDERIHTNSFMPQIPRKMPSWRGRAQYIHYPNFFCCVAAFFSLYLHDFHLSQQQLCRLRLYLYILNIATKTICLIA